MVALGPGDLFDRIAELEAAIAHAPEPARRAELGRSLAALTAARDRALPVDEALSGLAARLREAHETLLDLDRDLRACEARGDFGPAFVALARAALHVADEREALRREADRLAGARLPDAD